MTKSVLPRTSLTEPYGDVDPAHRDDVIAQDFKAVFANAAGARVLAHIMGLSDMFLSNLSRDRAARDMIDGKRELAMQIWELSGLKGGALALALVADDARKAFPEMKETDDEPDTDDEFRGERPADRGGREPLYPTIDDPSDAILTE